mgnify:CR=1 FL=1
MPFQGIRGIDDLAELIDFNRVAKHLGGRIIGHFAQQLIVDLALSLLVSSLLGNIGLDDLFGGRL